jgi:hypothetical protein
MGLNLKNHFIRLKIYFQWSHARLNEFFRAGNSHVKNNYSLVCNTCLPADRNDDFLHVRFSEHFSRNDEQNSIYSDYKNLTPLKIKSYLIKRQFKKY